MKKVASRIVLAIGAVITMGALYYSLREKTEETKTKNEDFKRGFALGYVMPGPFAVGAVVVLILYGV